MTVQFPTVQPDTPVLDRVHTELACLRTLSHQDLQTLADELRQFMLYLSLIHISEPTRPY